MHIRSERTALAPVAAIAPWWRSGQAATVAARALDWRGLRPFLAVAALFVATRIVLLLFTVREREFILPSVTTDVRSTYRDWFEILSTGSFPADDVMWQYPPAAALVLFAPALLPLSYAVGFYWISFAVDLLTFVVLLVAARRRMAEDMAAEDRAAEGIAAQTVGARGATSAADRPWSRHQPWAAWVWVVGVALGGPIAYGRYDLIVTGVAVCGLVLLVGAERPALEARRRHWTGGAVLALGALLKVWPALLLLVAGPGRRWRETWAAAFVAGSALLIAFWVSMPNALSFLSAQGGRGVEIESIAALPFHVATHHGWDGYVALNYGSWEYLGPHVDLATNLALAASALALAWLVLWRLTARTWHASTSADAALVAVLLFVVTSRVISPQYMVWLVGLGAVCALQFGPRGDSRMRLPVVLILIATALTCIEFPYLWQELKQAERGAVLLLTVRNLLLVAAVAIGARRLWRSTRAADGGGTLLALARQAGRRSRSQEMSAP